MDASMTVQYRQVTHVLTCFPIPVQGRVVIKSCKNQKIAMMETKMNKKTAVIKIAKFSSFGNVKGSRAQVTLVFVTEFAEMGLQKELKHAMTEIHLMGKDAAKIVKEFEQVSNANKEHLSNVIQFVGTDQFQGMNIAMTETLMELQVAFQIVLDQQLVGHAQGEDLPLKVFAKQATSTKELLLLALLSLQLNMWQMYNK